MTVGLGVVIKLSKVPFGFPLHLGLEHCQMGLALTTALPTGASPH